MKTLKYIFIAIFFSITTFAIVIYSSCKKDKCKGITCIHGACNEGICICPTGYYGIYCENTIVIDPCLNVFCQNGGTCSNGVCTCPTGYEGTHCEIVSRTKLMKVWSAADVNITLGSTSLPVYSPTFAEGSTITSIKINGFSDNFFTNPVSATFTGNVITIPNQQPDLDNYYVSGTGTYDTSTKKINWTYTLKNPSNVTQEYSGIWQ